MKIKSKTKRKRQNVKSARRPKRNNKTLRRKPTQVLRKLNIQAPKIFYGGMPTSNNYILPPPPSHPGCVSAKDDVPIHIVNEKQQSILQGISLGQGSYKRVYSVSDQPNYVQVFIVCDSNYILQRQFEEFILYIALQETGKLVKAYNWMYWTMIPPDNGTPYYVVSYFIDICNGNLTDELCGENGVLLNILSNSQQLMENSRGLDESNNTPTGILDYLVNLSIIKIPEDGIPDDLKQYCIVLKNGSTYSNADIKSANLCFPASNDMRNIKLLDVGLNFLLEIKTTDELYYKSYAYILLAGIAIMYCNIITNENKQSILRSSYSMGEKHLTDVFAHLNKGHKHVLWNYLVRKRVEELVKRIYYTKINKTGLFTLNPVRTEELGHLYIDKGMNYYELNPDLNPSRKDIRKGKFWAGVNKYVDANRTLLTVLYDKVGPYLPYTPTVAGATTGHINIIDISAQMEQKISNEQFNSIVFELLLSLGIAFQDADDDSDSDRDD